MDLRCFKQLPLLGIVRGVTEDRVESLIETVITAGLQTLEITMNTAGAGELIRRAVKASSGRLTIGAGTVMNEKEMQTALDAGATFIVTPVLVEKVCARCAASGVPIFPGALTPSEIHRAWNAGASMVKVFPAKAFGPAYFKDIKGPFSDIELLACSGVTPSNWRDYASAGASAAAFGGQVFASNRLKEKAFDAVEKDVRAYVEAVRKCAPETNSQQRR